MLVSKLRVLEATPKKHSYTGHCLSYNFATKDEDKAKFLADCLLLARIEAGDDPFVLEYPPQMKDAMLRLCLNNEEATWQECSLQLNENDPDWTNSHLLSARVCDLLKITQPTQGNTCRTSRTYDPAAKIIPRDLKFISP